MAQGAFRSSGPEQRLGVSTFPVSGQIALALVLFVLLDDEVTGATTDYGLIVALVSRCDEEAKRYLADGSEGVLLDHDQGRAACIGALADQGQRLASENQAVLELRDTRVDLAEQLLVAADPLFAWRQSRCLACHSTRLGVKSRRPPARFRRPDDGHAVAHAD